jgi:hypothetical protein
LLHSILRQEHRLEALRESELGLLEWRKRALSIGECKGQERRAIGGIWVYIELSQESSHWAQIQILGKVRGEPDNVRLELSMKNMRVLSGRGGQCPTGGFCLWMD